MWTRLAPFEPIEFYDGLEPAEYSAVVDPERTEPWLLFRFSDLARNDLRTAPFPRAVLEHMVQTHGFTEKDPLLPYKGTMGLCVSFFRHGDHLALASFGEVQPARYCVFLEGIWKLTGTLATP